MNMLGGVFPFYYKIVADISNAELRLDPAWRIGKGRKRIVYRLPNATKLILKIERGSTLRRRIGAFLPWLENLKEAYWCSKLHAGFPGCPYAPEVFGFARTDYGIALIEEYICNQDGSRALSPSAFVQRHGRLTEVLTATENLFYFFAEQHVVCNDISVSNILVRVDSGQVQAVLIDGFGENHPIPYPTVSKRLNSRKLERKKRRVLNQVLMSASL